MNLKHLFKIVSYLCFVVFGYLIAKFIDFRYFKISADINIMDIVSVTMTIFFAIIISTVFEKRNSNFRIEKDLIINRIGNIHDLTSALQQETMQGNIAYIEATSSLKRISSALSSIYKIVDKCHFKITDGVKVKLRTCLQQLRDNMTNTPIIITETTGNVPIEVRDGIIFYDANSIATIEVNFENLKDLLLELQIDVNKK